MENIFQSDEWADFKLATGYQESFRINSILILKKILPFGRSMLYSPMVSGSQVAGLRAQTFIDQVNSIVLKSKSIFFRLELDVPSDNEAIKQFNNLRKPGFRKAFEEMQPENSLVIDLAKTEEEILSGMKQKGRYNIKIARNAGLLISSDNKKGEMLDNFYWLYTETAKRQKITFRAKAYFEKLLDNLGGKDYARLYNVYARNPDDGKVLSAAIVVYSGEKAIYLFGASSDEHRNLMAPYLMQWQMIRDAKEKGYKTYDFFGIAPNDDENHPWAGITRFKKQFGGEEIKILGSYDLVFKPFEYKVFKMAEKLRRKS